MDKVITTITFECTKHLGMSWDKESYPLDGCPMCRADKLQAQKKTKLSKEEA